MEKAPFVQSNHRQLPRLFLLQLDQLCSKPTLRGAVEAAKKAHPATFTLVIDPSVPEACSGNVWPKGHELPEPRTAEDFCAAADLVELKTAAGTPLTLTAQQLELRNHLLNHVYRIVFICVGGNGGAGRLLLGRKGTGKTTVLLVLQGVLSLLLPPSVIVFFASADANCDFFSTIRRAINKRAVDPTLEAAWSDLTCGTQALLAASPRHRLVGLIDEYHMVYDYDAQLQWISSMNRYGQNPVYGTFILSGSSPYLRALAFGKAKTEDVKHKFRVYGPGLPNLNYERYTPVELLPPPAKGSTRRWFPCLAWRVSVSCWATPWTSG